MCNLVIGPPPSQEEIKEELKKRQPAMDKWMRELFESTEKSHRKAAKSKLYIGH